MREISNMVQFYKNCPPSAIGETVLMQTAGHGQQAEVLTAARPWCRVSSDF